MNELSTYTDEQLNAAVDRLMNELKRRKMAHKTEKIKFVNEVLYPTLRTFFDRYDGAIAVTDDDGGFTIIDGSFDDYTVDEEGDLELDYTTVEKEEEEE